MKYSSSTEMIKLENEEVLIITDTETSEAKIDEDSSASTTIVQNHAKSVTATTKNEKPKRSRSKKKEPKPVESTEVMETQKPTDEISSTEMIKLENEEVLIITDTETSQAKIDEDSSAQTTIVQNQLLQTTKNEKPKRSRSKKKEPKSVESTEVMETQKPTDEISSTEMIKLENEEVLIITDTETSEAKIDEDSSAQTTIVQNQLLQTTKNEKPKRSRSKKKEPKPVESTEVMETQKPTDEISSSTEMIKLENEEVLIITDTETSQAKIDEDSSAQTTIVQNQLLQTTKNEKPKRSRSKKKEPKPVESTEVMETQKPTDEISSSTEMIKLENKEVIIITATGSNEEKIDEDSGAPITIMEDQSLQTPEKGKRKRSRSKKKHPKPEVTEAQTLIVSELQDKPIDISTPTGIMETQAIEMRGESAEKPTDDVPQLFREDVTQPSMAVVKLENEEATMITGTGSPVTILKDQSLQTPKKEKRKRSRSKKKESKPVESSELNVIEVQGLISTPADETPQLVKKDGISIEVVELKNEEVIIVTGLESNDANLPVSIVDDQLLQTTKKEKPKRSRSKKKESEDTPMEDKSQLVEEELVKLEDQEIVTIASTDTNVESNQDFIAPVDLLQTQSLQTPKKENQKRLHSKKEELIPIVAQTESLTVVDIEQREESQIQLNKVDEISRKSSEAIDDKLCTPQAEEDRNKSPSKKTDFIDSPTFIMNPVKGEEKLDDISILIDETVDHQNISLEPEKSPLIDNDVDETKKRRSRSKQKKGEPKPKEIVVSKDNTETGSESPQSNAIAEPGIVTSMITFATTETDSNTAFKKEEAKQPALEHVDVPCKDDTEVTETTCTIKKEKKKRSRSRRKHVEPNSYKTVEESTNVVVETIHTVTPEGAQQNRLQKSEILVDQVEPTYDIDVRFNQPDENTESDKKMTYADIAALQAIKHHKEEVLSQPQSIKDPVKIRIQVVGESHLESEQLPVDSEGFTEMLSRKEKRARSRSRSEVQPEVTIEPDSASEKEEHTEEKEALEQLWTEEHHKTYANVAAVQQRVVETPKTQVPASQKDPVSIRIEVVSDDHPEHQPVPVDSEGFTEFLSRKERRSRSRSVTKSKEEDYVQIIEDVAEVVQKKSKKGKQPKDRRDSEQEDVQSTTEQTKTKKSKKKNVDDKSDVETKIQDENAVEKKKKRRRSKSPTGIIGMISSVKNALSPKSSEVPTEGDIKTQKTKKKDKHREAADENIQENEGFKAFLDYERGIALPSPSAVSEQRVPEKRSSFFGSLFAKITGSKVSSHKKEEELKNVVPEADVVQKKTIDGEPIKSKDKRKKSCSTSEGEDEKHERKLSGVFENIITKVSDVLKKKADSPARTSQNILCIHLQEDGPFWINKYMYDDAEENYQLYLAKISKSAPIIDKTTMANSNSHDKDGDSDRSSGRSSPKSPEFDKMSELGPNTKTEYSSANLPGGMCRWKGESTYLSIEAVICDAPQYDMLTMAKAEEQWYERMVRETKVLNEKPVSDYETIIADSISDKNSTQFVPYTSLGPLTTHTIPSAPSEEFSRDGDDIEIDCVHKKALVEDVQHLRSALEMTEVNASKLTFEDCKSILVALMNVTGDLKKHAAEAIRLENLVLQISSDNDSQILTAHLAGIRTKIATLLSQAENGTVAIENAQRAQMKRNSQLTEYQRLLIEIEHWLQITREILTKEVKPTTALEINNEIETCNALNRDLTTKEQQLSKLIAVCEEFKNYPDLKELSETLLQHLYQILITFNERKIIIKSKLEILSVELMNIQEENKASSLSSLQDNTLDSSSMPVEEIPVHADTKQFILTTKEPVGVSIETQTGQSLSSPSPTVSQFDSKRPIDAEIQTYTPEPSVEKESIKISKTIIGDQETIHIATKPAPFAKDGSGDLLVEADYRDMAENNSQKTTELNILHPKTNKPFETVMVEPDETTTEVIVDSDGTKRIIVKKMQRTVVSKQHVVQQQHLTTMNTLTEGDVPISQSFSQVTLQGQQSSTTIARGDGHKETLTSQNYGGKIVSGVPGGEINVQEFQSEPEHHYTVIEGSQPIEGLALHEGDVTLVDNDTFIPVEQGEEIHTSSSTVRAVVQQVTRKIIRKTRRIIRRIVIVDGKEQVTEEIVEEPEEVEITEEGIPRVSINVTRTQDGSIVQEQPQIVTIKTEKQIILDPDGNPIEVQGESESEEKPITIEEEPELMTSAVIEQDEKIYGDIATEREEPDERYVFASALEKSPAPSITEPKPASPKVTTYEFIEHEKSAPSTVEITRKVDEAPRIDIAQVKTMKSPDQEIINDTDIETGTDASEIPLVIQDDEKPVKEESTSVSISELDGDTYTIAPAETVIREVVTALPGSVEIDKVESSPCREYKKTLSSPALLETAVIKTLPHKPSQATPPIISTKSEIITTIKDEPAQEIIETTASTESESPKLKEPTTMKSSGVDVNTQFIITEQQSLHQQIPNQQISLHLTESQIRLVSEPSRTVEFSLTLEEKPIKSEQPSPMVSMTMTVDNDPAFSSSEVLQKDIYVSLPTTTVKTSSPMVPKIETSSEEISLASEVDHGGTKSRKKKKHKQPDTPEKTPQPTASFTPEEEDEKIYSVESSLAESTDIVIADDSRESPYSPKYTEEYLNVVTPDESEDSPKDTGYEPDYKTTVDENVEETQEKKKKQKKHKKQKIKVFPHSEESLEPKSVDSTTPIGQLSDEEPIKEVADTNMFEANLNEIHSPNDSYKSMLTLSETDSVKIIEEGFPTPPETESLESITSKIVTTVPVIEAVITQEETVQTSPEVSEITEDKPQVTEEVLKLPKENEEVSIQTSPEVPKETSDVSLQFDEEQQQTINKPEIVDSSSQVIITLAESVTQTSTPECVESPKRTSPKESAITTLDSSMQTVTPMKVETIEGTVQTITPEVTELVKTDSEIQTVTIPVQEESVQTTTPEVVEYVRSDSQMQTAEVPMHEESVQTITPDVVEVQIKETSEFSSQIHPHDISKPLEECVQTSPIPSAPSLDEITQTSIRYEPPTLETTDITVQTTPLVVKELGEEVTSRPALVDDTYEVHVQALVTLPSDETSKTSPILTIEDNHFNESYVDHSDTDSDFDVQVEIDGKPVPYSSVTTFLESERSHQTPEKRHRKKHKKQKPIVGAHPEKDLFDQFKRVEDQSLDPNLLYSEVVKKSSRASSPVPEELDVKEVKSFEDDQKQLEEATVVRLSFTIPQESPESTPEKSVVTPTTSIEVQPSEVLVTELSIDTAYVTPGFDAPSKEKRPIKQKGKGKHKTSVTIEEVLSPTEIVDTPLTPELDNSITSETIKSIWRAPIVISKTPSSRDFIESEKQVSLRPKQSPQELGVQWAQTKSLERIKNLHNAQKTTQLSEVLFLATLNETVTDESIEEKNDTVQQNLNSLRSAIRRGDVIIVQQTIVTTVETITTWLQTIEYRIYVQRQQTGDGPSRKKLEEFTNLKGEIANIENNVRQLQDALANTGDIYNEDERNRMKNYVESLENQLKLIEEVTQQNEQIVADDYARWQQFINGLENISHLVNDVKKQFNALLESDASPQTKLQELEDLETLNRSHMLKTVHLIAAARGLMRDFPNREIPLEVYTMHDATKQIDHHISVQREKSLHLLALAEEYVQTLKEFEQIIEIADALVDSPISVQNLGHLEEEVQNHRKFFINLSHCRAILESLEENLDSETKMLHSPLHQDLYERASVILDKAGGRLQQMSLAASRWTILEQGMKDEHRWLEVARGRVPDLNNVTSVDFDQYINLYQSLSSDIAHHHAKLAHLNNNAQKLQELVVCTGLEQTYTQPLEIITELHEDVSNKLKRLTSFRDSWTTYNALSDKLEYWLKLAEQNLNSIDTIPNTKIPIPSHMRQFWELKAQHEVYNTTRLESANALEKSMEIIPVADEMLQRKFHSELQSHWQKVSKDINEIQTAITENISAPDMPIDEKLVMLEQELDELKAFIEGLGGVIKNEEELNLYIERLQIMLGRVETIQNELGRLGLLSATDSEKVGDLLALSKNVEIQISEELDGSVVLRDRLQAIQRGLSRVRRNLDRLEQSLNQCEHCEKQSGDVVEKAANDCREVGEELITLWQDLMGLRQLLHTLPMRLRVTVSPTKVERDISQLQDSHAALEKRCGKLLAMLRGRLALWQRFERQLELVQRNVQEADFMMELFTVQGQVDYDRLLKATERLEGLSGDFVNRETLLKELRSCAEPLASSCTPEVSAHVEAAVTEAVAAWEDTCTNLRELCTRYHNAADLWKQYRDASEATREWCDTQMESVNGLPPEEAIKTVKVCEEALTAHTSRLAELRNLVSGIATAVGLDENALLGGEVEALGRRLQDVRESLTVLADVADAQAKSKIYVQEEFAKAKTYLASVQQNISSIQSEPDNDLDNKLEMLREHLLDLSKTENKIQKLKENSLEMSRPTKTESTVLETLQLWQQVFRDTFQQYHRLSTRLVKNEDSVAALKLWQEYLLHVQQFLLGSIPSEYNSLAEHQRLLEVHQNLLTTQQSILQPLNEDDNKLFELSISEQFNSLTNLHNETLSKIADRHLEVRNRLNAWDRYRFDQNRLLAWLRDMEKERERLQLRYIHIRRVAKVLLKIQNLLSQIPHGEEQAAQLQKQQTKLLRFTDDAFGASIRMEHVAITQRISNIQAGLETWKQFLEKINMLVKVYEEKVKKVQDLFNNSQETINISTKEMPTTHSSIVHKLETIRQMRGRLNESSKDLEQLGVTQEQLKECVSPMDMKTISQQMWLLWHQQGDLDHQLSVLCHQLEERLGMRSTFEARHSRFMVWADNLEQRLEKDQENGDPNEVLKKLETELQTEMSLKNHEYKWLTTTGKELVSACGEDYSDVVAKQNLQVKTDEVRKRWERLDKLVQSRVNKIQDMTQTMLQLEVKIAEIKSWLHQTKIKLSKLLVFDDASKNAMDKLKQEHEVLKKSIEKESSTIGEVINLWELLLTDADIWKIHFNMETITLDIQDIEKRWKNVCEKSAERKQKITFIWNLLFEILRMYSEQEEWLISQEKKLKEFDKPVDKLTKDQINDKIAKIENLIKEIESRTPTFKILEQTYSKLIKTTDLDVENIKKLTAKVRQLLIQWHNILPHAHNLLQLLQHELNLYKQFSAAQGNAIMSLTRVDAQLTDLQHLLEMSIKERLEQLDVIEELFVAQNATLENADKLGLLLMQKRPKQEIPKIQEMIDEYQLLWKDIQERIVQLKSDLIRQKEEVDASIQVETLKFQQDTAVQVNTLPPQLQRMTSISPKDAYMVELTSAVGECTSNVVNLENMIEKDIPQEGSSELHIIAQRIAKLLASSQSSIELMNHLHNILVNECDASDEEARTEDVETLTNRFNNITAKAQQREVKIRELSEAGRLLCPLCTKRNWAQLDNDLWRLEKWLQAAKGIQSSQQSPPSNIEMLEDVIQDHREFLLDLDSHKSIIRSLNIVGTHLADHTEDTEKGNNLRERLGNDNKVWDKVCANATVWQTHLQKALMDNHQFHAIVEELCVWLEKTENQIKQFEPVDLTLDTQTINAKFEQFYMLKSELEHCEPRVLSLQENANQLLKDQQAPEGSVTICARLNELRLKLHSLIRLTRIYVLKLGAVLGRDTNDLGLHTVAQPITAGSSLHSFNYDLLDNTTATPGPTTAPDDGTYTGTTDDLKINTTVLRRGYRFLGRVIRASLPIQALMLLLLGVASLVPYTEDDYACSLVNNFANNFQPMLHYRNGPPAT
ncbi:hypothetical protein FQA39_LY14119 [Lamprigera yunnana]|nr:hypothetical protein FQA39_LY14119 [Lamprigera yunnana]